MTMNRRGFSLIELITVMALISIMLTIATINFNSWQRKSTVERYAKEIFSDVQDARLTAAFTKVRQGVVFSPQQIVFRRFTSDGDVSGTIITTKQLPVSITTNVWALPTASRIDFGTRGLMSDPLIKVICITTTEEAAYDALIITPALTSMGKVTDRGSACARTNVTQK